MSEKRVTIVVQKLEKACEIIEECRGILKGENRGER